MNTPPLFGELGDLRASFGELSSYSKQEQMPFDAPSFIDPDVVIRKSDSCPSSDEAFIQRNGVSEVPDAPLKLELEEPASDLTISLPVVTVEDVDKEEEPTAMEATTEPWKEQTILLSREGSRRANRRKCTESTFLNRTKKTFE